MLCLASLGERTHIKVRAQYSLFLSTGHPPTRYSPVSRPRDSPLDPPLLPAGHRFSREGTEEGRRRKKTEQESSAKCDYRRLAESFGFSSPLRRVASLPLSLSLSLSFRSPPPRLLPSFFTSFRCKATVGMFLSYVHVSRTEGRKTWVLIRARRGCGSSRHYFTRNRLSLFVCVRCLTRIRSLLLIRVLDGQIISLVLCTILRNLDNATEKWSIKILNGIKR